MDQNEVLKMARQANATDIGQGTAFHFYRKELEAFAKLIASAAIAKEREALLDIVYSYAKSLSWNEDFQADVRARGEAQ